MTEKKFWLKDAGLSSFDVNDLGNKWTFDNDANDFYTTDQSEFDWFKELGEAYATIENAHIDLVGLDFEEYQDYIDYAKDLSGFWRVGTHEKEIDVKTCVEAKTELGKSLVENPTKFHWMAFGWLDKDGKFETKEGTLITLS